jgi:hypothetical protein
MRRTETTRRDQSEKKRKKLRPTKCLPRKKINKPIYGWDETSPWRHSIHLILSPFFSFRFSGSWPNLSGCSSPPGENQCPRSSTLDPEEGEGRTLPKYSQAQKNQAKLGSSVPLGKSEAMINVRTFPGSPSTIRYDTTRDTHTSPPQKAKNFGGLSFTDAHCIFFCLLPVKTSGPTNFSFGN